MNEKNQGKKYIREKNNNKNKKPMISPMGDRAFKRTFLDPKNEECLTDLLLAIIDIPQSEFDHFDVIDPLPLDDTSLEFDIVDPHQFEADINKKAGIFDLKVRLKDGTLIGIEVQIVNVPDLADRMVNRISSLIVSQTDKGEEYGAIAQNHVILISETEVSGLVKTTEYYDAFNWRSKITNRDFSTKHFIHVLNISKVPKINDGTRKWQWAKFFQGKETEEMNMIIKENKAIKKAYNAIQEMSQDEKERARNEAILGMERQEKRSLNVAEFQGMQKGLQQGLQQGMQQEKQKMVVAMLKNNLPIATIASCSNLSETEINDIKVKYKF